MKYHVPFITVEDEDIDLVVSFGLGPNADNSLTLLRTPGYESILSEDERGVSVGASINSKSDRELLISIRWINDEVQIVSTEHTYLLSISSVALEEISYAKAVIEKMNFDQRFKIHDA